MGFCNKKCIDVGLIEIMAATTSSGALAQILNMEGRSKVLIGKDEIDNWRKHLPVLLDSVAANGGRSCINASSILVPSRGDEIAAALAQELAKHKPCDPGHDDATLSAFANRKFAEFIDTKIKADIARDLKELRGMLG